MRDYWLENAGGAVHTIVDLGYIKDQAARDRADQLLAHVPARGNLQRAGGNRLMVRIPPGKVKTVLRAFPQIVAGAAGYCWCTHGWLN